MPRKNLLFLKILISDGNCPMIRRLPEDHGKMKIQTFSDDLSDPAQTVITPFPYQTSKHGTLTGIEPLFKRGTMSYKGKE